jgi:CarD family transcriptional regulator
MAARKKSSKKRGPSKSVRTKVVPTEKRTKKSSRPAAARAGKAASKSRQPPGKTARATRRPGGKQSVASKNAKRAERAKKHKETLSGGKATLTGGATKNLNRERTSLAVDDQSTGNVVDVKLQAKIPQKIKTQAPVIEEPALKAEKIDVSAVAGVKSVEPSAVKATTPPGGRQRPASREELGAPAKPAKAAAQRQGFKLNEFVVYPAHGVGQIVAIEEQEVAGFRLELFVISFSKDKMTLRVPTSKVVGVGMRKISDPETAKRSLDILSGRARIKRTMWSRRAQEYETKINSGDITAIAEVVRDLYRSEAQPEQSYSERQLYEAALDRMVREIAAVQKSNEIDALKAIETQLQKTQNRQAKAATPEVPDPEIEEAA